MLAKATNNNHKSGGGRLDGKTKENTADATARKRTARPRGTLPKPQKGIWMEKLN
jgi:hypothetical protein